MKERTVRFQPPIRLNRILLMKRIARVMRKDCFRWGGGAWAGYKPGTQGLHTFSTAIGLLGYLMFGRLPK